MPGAPATPCPPPPSSLEAPRARPAPAPAGQRNNPGLEGSQGGMQLWRWGRGGAQHPSIPPSIPPPSLLPSSEDARRGILPSGQPQGTGSALLPSPVSVSPLCGCPSGNRCPGAAGESRSGEGELWVPCGSWHRGAAPAENSTTKQERPQGDPEPPAAASGAPSPRLGVGWTPPSAPAGAPSLHPMQHFARTQSPALSFQPPTLGRLWGWRPAAPYLPQPGSPYFWATEPRRDGSGQISTMLA